MQRFVVTGANKGIGLAVVKTLLETNKNAFVFLGSRDATRGKDAVSAIVAEDTTGFSGRVEALEIDVSDAGSVSRAVETVRARLGDDPEQRCYLSAIINNAGVAIGEGSQASFEMTMRVNYRGVVQTTEAFLPLLDPSKGRVVITSSAAGPSFVAKCSPDRQAVFVDPSVTRDRIESLLEECLAIASGGWDGVAERFAAVGMTGAERMSGYGLSKALVNLYTMQLARDNPSLMVNAATPGFIATDLTQPWAKMNNKTLEEMGAKRPEEGAKPLVYLATGDVPRSGWYFGSDMKRSPLDRYRAPGSPEYDGQ